MFSSMSPGLFSSSMSYSFHPPERVTPHPGAPSSRLAGICARGRIGGGGGVVRGCDGRTLGGPRGRSLAGDKQRRQMTEEAGLRVDTKGASRWKYVLSNIKAKCHVGHLWGKKPFGHLWQKIVQIADPPPPKNTLSTLRPSSYRTLARIGDGGFRLQVAPKNSHMGWNEVTRGHTTTQGEMRTRGGSGGSPPNSWGANQGENPVKIESFLWIEFWKLWFYSSLTGSSSPFLQRKNTQRYMSHNKLFWTKNYFVIVPIFSKVFIKILAHSEEKLTKTKIDTEKNRCFLKKNNTTHMITGKQYKHKKINK